MTEGKALSTVERVEIPRVELIPANATKNQRAVLGEFSRWLDETGRTWLRPDLLEFQTYLLTRDETRVVGTYTGDNGKHSAGDDITKEYKPIAASSIATYTAIIRGRFKALQDDNAVRQALFDYAGAALAELGQDASPANRKAWVDETLTRLANGVKPSKDDVKPVKVQDRTDSQVGLRLTKDQADQLLASPGLVPIDRLRDTALLSLFLCTGLREQEVADLTVDDLRQKVDGELCVVVREGKGKKQRCVPWGAGSWALAYVDKWLARAGIEGGRVFRSFYKPRRDGSRRMREGGLSTRAIQKIVGSYKAMVDGETVVVHPHDLRRTYARRCYDAGMDILAIRDNLGHADHKTTLGYIGVQEMDTRKPPSLFSPPHWSELESLEIQGRIVDASEGDK